MAPSILSLLHLGLCLGQMMRTRGGADHKLFLSIRPSPVVPLGGRVTLSCHSQFPLGTFKLFKHNSSRDSEMQTGSFRHNLTLEPVSREHAGTCSCSGPGSRTAVSAQSDPRDIVVTGVATGPSLSAHPGPRVHKGGNVTLRCSSERAWDQFTLHKDGAMEYGRQPGQRLPAEQSQAHFPMGPVDSAHAGTYRCYGSLRRSPHEWSAPSDPLDLVVSGLYKKPSLSAHPGPVVTAGENVTLTCSSNHSFDKYHLSRDGDARAHQFPVVQRDRDVFRADFSLGPAPSGHSGTYRCYGSFRGSASQWSAPSDPVHLSVPGTAESTGLSPPNSSAEPGDKRGSQPGLCALARGEAACDGGLAPALRLPPALSVPRLHCSGTGTRRKHVSLQGPPARRTSSGSQWPSCAWSLSLVPLPNTGAPSEIMPPLWAQSPGKTM
ncbi:putative killer cell immunoglobulin-like receptor-like protein KIR3DX1 isoform X7 [Tupaia chinensis]|uniref:putative killer cell immunoglobulin-like receptor-like protein KIR3DX1 isoform X7 n=1 Tax=Tupaia chinensis TaxID=246437 RepID=UPI000FFCB34D|nr:putative killer cell immunoglobulin-like receptor-like protein KIR3DX1 isoform X7 [Tupaia chinensis]